MAKFEDAYKDIMKARKENAEWFERRTRYGFNSSDISDLLGYKVAGSSLAAMVDRDLLECMGHTDWSEKSPHLYMIKEDYIAKKEKEKEDAIEEKKRQYKDIVEMYDTFDDYIADTVERHEKELNRLKENYEFQVERENKWHNNSIERMKEDYEKAKAFVKNEVA